MRITTTYDRISAPAKRKVTCPGCGKKRTIRRTFHQTENPFSRHDDGTPRTRPEITDEVIAQARAWEPAEREKYHVKCAEGDR